MAFGKNPPEGEGKGPSLFLKFEEGKKRRIHIVSKEPLAFKSYYNKVNNKFIRVPVDKQLPVKTTWKWAAVVLIDEAVDGVSAIVARIFEFGKQIKGQLDEASEVYNDNFEGCDFVVGKTGKGLKTEWTATPCPAKGMKFEGDLPDLVEHVKMSSDEDIKTYCSATLAEDKQPPF